MTMLLNHETLAKEHLKLSSKLLFESLDSKNEDFKVKLAELISLINTKLVKDSHHSYNSHNPPSSNMFNPNPKSLIKKTSRRVGVQNGYRGLTLKQLKALAYVKRHESFINVQTCEKGLVDKDKIWSKKIVFDIPKFVIEVTEHQSPYYGTEKNYFS